MSNNEHLLFRLKSWLRKQGIANHMGVGVMLDEDGNDKISGWPYELPQPNVNDVPSLTDEETFHEVEDTNTYMFTNDILVVSSSGNLRADRRQSLSALDGNAIVLEPGRYYLDSSGGLKFYVNDLEVSSIFKTIHQARITVETPTNGEVTVVIWKI